MRKLLPLAALAAALFAVWLFFQDGGGGGAPSEGGAGAAEVARASAAGGPVTPAAAPGAAQEPDLGRTMARTEPAAPQPPSFSDHPGPWLTIEVVRGEPALPVAGATVTVLIPDREDEEALMMHFLAGTSVPELLAAYGTSLRADAAGKVRIPVPAVPGILTAESGDGFALAEWEPTAAEPAADRELRLALAPAYELLIAVADASGRPLAGVPVSLRFSDDNFSFDFLRGLTAEDGVAHMRHAIAFMKVFGPGMDLPCFAAVVAPLPEPVQAPLDLGDPPTTPVRLILPEHGRVEVAVRRADGAPAPDGQLVFLSRPQQTSEDDDDFFIPGLPGFDSVAAKTSDGRASFAYVGLGMELQATTVFDAAPESSRVVARGPERPGESVRIELAEQLDYPVLSGRLLGPDGAPLDFRTVQLRVSEMQNDFGLARAECVVGADGAFRLGLPAHFLIPRPQPAELWMDGSGAEQTLSVAIVIPPLQPGDNPLGELRALPPPLLVAGRVLGADDRPVAGASVAPMQWVRWDERDPTQGEWTEDWEEMLQCDADGAFALYGAVREEGLRLVVDARGFIRQEIEAAPGTKDLLVRLESGGSLRGRVLTDPGVPADALILSLLIPGTGFEDEVQHWSSPSREDGGFAFSGLRPGIGRLTVSADGSSREESRLLVLDGIALGPGAVPDPRLDPVDLRGLVHYCRVRARGEGGEPIGGLRLWRESAPEAVFHGQGGEALAMSAAPLGRLVVSAPGWRRATVDAAQAEVEVKLRRGPELLLTVPSSAARSGGAALGVQLVFQADGNLDEYPRGFFAPDGTLRLRVQEPGDYTAIFIASRADAALADDWEIGWIQPDEGASQPSFTVRDLSGEQRFPLPPPPAAAILAALGSAGRPSVLVQPR